MPAAHREEPFPLRNARAYATAAHWGKTRCEIGWD